MRAYMRRRNRERLINRGEARARLRMAREQARETKSPPRQSKHGQEGSRDE
jgi:hypothetical protein